MGQCLGKKISAKEKDEETQLTATRHRPQNTLTHQFNGLPSPAATPKFWPSSYPPEFTTETLLPDEIALSPARFTCEACKVDCNGQRTFNTHNMGKKHKANLRKLQHKITPKPYSQIPSSSIKEDLQAKKEKVVQGGAPEEGIMICNICDVVCNSKAVYETHITGRKHLAMI